MDFFYEEDDKISENEIQTLYELHPYLINERFLNQEVISQYRVPSGFIDIMIKLPGELVIIELKVEKLNSSHVLQLNGYLEDIQKDKPNIKNISGILIGYQPKKKIDSLLKSLKFSINIKILIQDVPIKIKTCTKCRLTCSISKNNCPFCTSTDFL